jgi:Predicted nucleoside-diphosphate-sugar epimerases
MTQKKIIAVAGATGAQGGGVVRAILRDKNGSYAARALTRDPNSDKARQLADLGAEVVKADLHDPDSVKKAFEGAYGAYCVTFFWNHLSPETELKEATNLANAARDAGLKHVIWSTLEDTRKYVPLDDTRMPTLMGKYKVPHFDVKGEADAVFRDSGVPTTYLLASFFWENFIRGGSGPKKDQNGDLVLSLPMANAKLTGIASEDIGRCAYGVFLRGQVLADKHIGLAGDQLTGDEMAQKFSKALGKPVRYNAVPFDVFRGLGFPAAEELGNMFQFYAEFADVLVKSRDVAASRELNPELQSFDQWLSLNKDKLPLE